MSATLELDAEVVERIRVCMWKASRVNFDCQHRIELRKLLCQYDLAVAQALVERFPRFPFP